MQRIAVIDYGMGNLRSVSKALEHVVDADCEIRVTSDQALIADSDRVVCPGQGAANDCMRQLAACGMDAAVRQAISDGRPFLGICMGLQVLLTASEENGGTPCLDILAGQVKRFSHGMRDAATGNLLKVPHMGWSPVAHAGKHALWADIPSQARFYFCHSYYVVPDADDLAVGQCEYGQSFAAVLAKDNIFACQFHPEKSGTLGVKLYENFLKYMVDRN